jgi:hypothetical protein
MVYVYIYMFFEIIYFCLHFYLNKKKSYYHNFFSYNIFFFLIRSHNAFQENGVMVIL